MKENQTLSDNLATAESRCFRLEKGSVDSESSEFQELSEILRRKDEEIQARDSTIAKLSGELVRLRAPVPTVRSTSLAFGKSVPQPIGRMRTQVDGVPRRQRSLSRSVELSAVATSRGKLRQSVTVATR